MIKSLTIKNVALIKSANIFFTEGLNVLSGETGAGKSVVLESLNFALGQKADKAMISHGENECSVSCVFDISNNDRARSALNDIGVEFDDEIIIKRTFSLDGKASIRINGEIVTAQMLKKVSINLVDIHGQSDHFILLKESNQLELIDALGEDKIKKRKDEIKCVIDRIKDIDKNLSLLGGSDEERLKRLDFIKYSIDEIERADVKEGEHEELSLRRKKLLNLEKITGAVSNSVSILSGDNGVIDSIANSIRLVDSVSNFGEEFRTISERLSTIMDDLSDINETLYDLIDEEFDAKEIEFIESRIDEISLIESKYGKTYEEIQEKLKSLRDEYNLLQDSAFEAGKLRDKKFEELKLLKIAYSNLTNERKLISETLSKKLSLKLKELGMKGAKFSVLFEELQDIVSLNGVDKITFMFSANVGEEEKPLSKVISGGELSRLMLAIKAVTSATFGDATFIFDEIDAGISGDAAFVVSQNFAKIAKNRQIIAISHLPQIVAMADTSLLIEKSEKDGKTTTDVFKQSKDEKIYEVVRLTGGKKDNEVAVAHAKQIVCEADKFKMSL